MNVAHHKGLPFTMLAIILGVARCAQIEGCPDPTASEVSCKLDVPVFVLGLSHGTHRLDVREAAGKCNQNVVAVKAVDGRLDDKARALTLIDPDAWANAPGARNDAGRSNTQISKGELATTVSHLLAAREAFSYLNASGEEYALVIEEDADLTQMHLWPYSIKEWVNRSGMQQDWQCAMLGATSYDEFSPYVAMQLSSTWEQLAKLAISRSLPSVPRTAMKRMAASSRSLLWGAFAVLYSKKGLADLLAKYTLREDYAGRFAIHGMGNENVADSLIYETLRTSFVAVPPLILHDDGKDNALDMHGYGLGANWGAEEATAASLKQVDAENVLSQRFSTTMMQLAWCGKDNWTPALPGRQKTISDHAAINASLDTLRAVVRSDAMQRRLSESNGLNSTFTGSERRMCSRQSDDADAPPYANDADEKTYYGWVWANGTFPGRNWRNEGLACLGYAEGPCASSSDCAFSLECGIDNCRDGATGQLFEGFSEGEGCCERNPGHRQETPIFPFAASELVMHTPKYKLGEGDCSEFSNNDGCWPGLECVRDRVVCTNARYSGIANDTAAAAYLWPGFLSAWEGFDEFSQSAPDPYSWDFIFKGGTTMTNHDPSDAHQWSQMARMHEVNMGWPNSTHISDLFGLVPAWFNIPMQGDFSRRGGPSGGSGVWKGNYGWGNDPEASLRENLAGTFLHEYVNDGTTPRVNAVPQFAGINPRDYRITAGTGFYPNSWPMSYKTCCSMPASVDNYQLEQRCELKITEFRDIPSHQRLDTLPYMPRLHLYDSSGTELKITRIEHAMGTQNQYLTWAADRGNAYSWKNKRYDSKEELDALAEERGLSHDQATFYADVAEQRGVDVASYKLFTGYVMPFDPVSVNITCYSSKYSTSATHPTSLANTSFRSWPVVFQAVDQFTPSDCRFCELIPLACSNACPGSGNGACQDGGANAAMLPGTSIPDDRCPWGSDCTDCGPRLNYPSQPPSPSSPPSHPPPPMPPSSPPSHPPPPMLCTNGCMGYDNGRCQDGGPGDQTGISPPECLFGDDCNDCGARDYDPPSPPPSASPSPPPSASPSPPPSASPMACDSGQTICSQNACAMGKADKKGKWRDKKCSMKVTASKAAKKCKKKKIEKKCKYTCCINGA